MIVYLNGCSDDSNGQLGSLKSFLDKAKKTITKLVPPKLLPKVILDKIATVLKKDATKAVNTIEKDASKFVDTVKLDTQKAIDASKAEAKKLKLGIQRLASIPQQIVNKTFLNAVEHNYAGIAPRLAQGYKIDPKGLKDIWAANKGNWNDLRDAINKGAKTAISGTRIGDGSLDTGTTYDASDDSQLPPDDTGNSGDATGGDNTTPAKTNFWSKAVGIFKQIFAWFKKLKKKKSTDDTIVNAMGQYVDANPTIPKFDENGNLLPNADGSFPPEQKSSTSTLLTLAAVGIGAKVLLFSH